MVETYRYLWKVNGNGCKWTVEVPSRRKISHQRHVHPHWFQYETLRPDYWSKSHHLGSATACKFLSESADCNNVIINSLMFFYSACETAHQKKVTCCRETAFLQLLLHNAQQRQSLTVFEIVIIVVLANNNWLSIPSKATTYAPESSARNRYHKFDARFWSVSYHLASNFYRCQFLELNGNCSISVPKTGTNSLLWLVDRSVYIQCFQCLEFWIWGSTWNLREIETRLGSFRETQNNNT